MFEKSKRNLLKSKRSQAEIIVTVLIILIVLAVIVVVAMFVTRTVREGTESASIKADCATLDLAIVQPRAGDDSVSVERGADSKGNIMESINVYVDGTVSGDAGEVPAELETKAVATGLTLAEGNVVKIAPVLTGGKLCDFKDEVTVTAAA